MRKTTWLSNQFLIAMPSLTDPNFYRSVTYMCEHNAEGAMGIVINQPLELTFGDVLQEMSLETADDELRKQAIYLGGPVQPDRGFVIHSPLGSWDSTLRVTADIGVTASRDIIAAIAAKQGPQRSLIALGYASWGAGQLERELSENTWLTGPADSEIIFDMPVARRWRAAASLVGVDLATISTDIGHA